MTNEQLRQLQGLDYQVDVASADEDDQPHAYRITGYGIDLMVGAADDDSPAAVLDMHEVNSDPTVVEISGRGDDPDPVVVPVDPDTGYPELPEA